MKATATVLVAAILVFVGGWFGYSRRFQIAAKIWHWRHGYFTRVGDYVVPVPEHWLVEEVTFETVELVDTSARGPRKDPLWGINVIMVGCVRTTGTPNLDFWKTYRQQQMERHGARYIEERTLHVADNTVVCLGGHQFRDEMHFPSSIVSVECASTSTLQLMFVGQQSNLEDFYTLVSQIRKQR